jgi:hypothetical protein
MIIRSRSWLAPLAGGVAGLVAALAPQPASSQLLFDWAGGSTVGGSGREVIRFNTRYGKGQIIVSFGDRRLYFINQPGEAISYPIAVPR